MTKLNAKTLTSKIAKKEIVSKFPNAAKFIKKHVAGIGYVLFVKDENNNTVAKCFKENGFLVLVK